MRTLKILSLSLLAMLMLTSVSFADLNAGQIVSSFNGLSANGLQFRYSTSTNEVNIYQVSAVTPFANTSAYSTSLSTGGNNSYFRTFCIEPTKSVVTSGTAKLNYENNKTVNSAGKALTVGAALLYTRFATGALASSYNYANSTTRGNDAIDLRTAIQSLMGVYTGTVNWNNKYLQYLLSIDSNQSYWTAVYDPGHFYNEIGQYSVFVMQVKDSSGNGDYQDFIYVAQASTVTTVVPEPATILLWSLGGVGAVAGGLRRRNGKKS